MSFTPQRTSGENSRKGFATASVHETGSSHGSASAEKQRHGSTGDPTLHRQHSGLDLEKYFDGPRDMQKHSKLPFFMRLHGSVMPKMILPLTVVGLWSTLITLIHHFKTKLGKTCSLS